MGKKSKKGRVDVVYSTKQDYEYDYEGDSEEETLDPSEQLLEVRFEKKGRGGKTVVLITGFVGLEEDLKELGKSLKSHCGVGGSTKDVEILLQGDVRNKAMAYLKKEGYGFKRVGG